MKWFQKQLKRILRSDRLGGFSLVEILVAVSILVILFIAIASQFGSANIAMQRTLKKTQVGFLLVEGVEVVKLLRSKSYTGQIKTLATSTPYYLHWTGTRWETTSTSDPIDDTFTRTVVLKEVYRATSTSPNAGDIVTGSVDPSDVYDPGTRKLIVTVLWPTQTGTTSEKIVTYITNIYGN